MSIIAEPVPKMSKRRNMGGANTVRLLRWAIAYMEIVTTDLRACNSNRAGKFDNRAIKTEVLRCEKWLKLAKEQLQ